MILDVLLEFLLGYTKLSYNLDEFALDKHLLFLGHIHNDFLIHFVIISVEGFSTLDDKLFFLGRKLILAIKRADSEYFQEVFEVDHS